MSVFEPTFKCATEALNSSRHNRYRDGNAPWKHLVQQAIAINAELTASNSATGLLPIERDVRHVSRQSLVATRDLRAGEIILRSDLTIKRPGIGLAPYMLGDVIGKRVRRDISEDFPLREEDIR